MNLDCLYYFEEYDTSQVIRSAEEAVGEAFSTLAAHESQWGRCQKTLKAKVWDAQDEQDEESIRVSFPEARNVIARHASLMTDSNPTLTLYPAAPNTTPDAARQLTEALRGWWIAERFGLEQSRVIQAALTYGVGVIEVGWDAYRGRPYMREIDPRFIAPDPWAVNLTDATYIVKNYWLNGYEISRRWPDVDLSQLEEGEQPKSADRFGSPPKMTSRTVISGGQPMVSVPIGPPVPYRASESGGKDNYGKSGTRYKISELWLRLDERTRRVFTFSGRALLNPPVDQPFQRHFDYRWWEVERSYVGMSFVELILPMLRILNAFGTAIADNVLAFIDPVELMDLSTAELQQHAEAVPGRRIIRADGTKGFEYSETALVSPDSYRLFDICLDAIQRTSGLDPFGTMEMSRQRRSASEVEHLSERQHVTVRQDIKAWEQTMERASTALANIIAERLDRRIAVPSLSAMSPRPVIDLSPAHVRDPQGIPMEFAANVELGSIQAMSYQARSALGMVLYDKELIDAPRLLEYFLELPGVPAILEELEENKRQQLAQLAGIPEEAHLAQI